jgi:type I restriction enzyme S subunit
MSEFQIFSLGELGSFKNGVNFSRRDFGQDIPLVNVKQLYRGRFVDPTNLVHLRRSAVKKLDDYSLKENDILFARSSVKASGAGQVAMVSDIVPNTVFSGFIIRLRIEAKDKVNPLFLGYLLRSPQYRQIFQKIGNGTTIINLTQETLSSVIVEIPLLPTQERIADILGSLDDKIELNRQMNQTLEAMARAIFKSWFVDFDPVYAKMEGREYPLPAEVMDLFPEELVESELGLIPRGWEVKTINRVVETVGGATPSTKNPDFWENGIHHFATPKDLSNITAPILITTERKITDLGLQKISSRLLDKGTLLMSSRAPVGYLAITDIPVCINQGFIAMKCNRSLSTLYMLNWAISNMQEIQGRASGTTFKEISKQNFRTMEVLVPSTEMIVAFDSIVQSLYEKMTINLHQNDALSSIRDILLPKLMSGEVEV